MNKADRLHRRRESDRLWRERNRDSVLEASRERSKAWRAANPDRSRTSCREHHSTNAETIRERKRVYYQTVRKAKDKTDEGRFKDRDRKARRRALIANDRVTMEEWRTIVSAFEGYCAYCGAMPEVLEMDHVTPLARGGRHIASNIVPSCKPCNSAKGAR
jgi:5-methylcytosine-specific restriction endonuclease McrA